MQSPQRAGASVDGATATVSRRRSARGEQEFAKRPEHHKRAGQSLANGLGWFSVGLGLTQLVAARTLSRLIGFDGRGLDVVLMRMIGLREVGAGAGLLLQSRKQPWVIARLGGDVMDKALLGAAILSGQPKHRGRTLLALGSVLGVGAADLQCSLQLTSEANHVIKAITIRRSPDEVYSFWHDIENLPRFMHNLESVRTIGPRRSHWRAKGPGGKSVEWDAEITDDQPNQLIAWRTLPGAAVTHSGRVHFRTAPANRGTEVVVELSYETPLGGLGRLVAWLTGSGPEQEIYGDLRRLKQVLELGEVVVSDVTLDGTGLRQGPAQPPHSASATQTNR
jgi:uncharacterized membrane protein